MPSKRKDYERPIKPLISHVYKERQHITLHDVTMHRQLFGYLKILFREGCFKDAIAPLNLDILDHLPTLNFVPGLLQAYTCCRYSELRQITIHIIKKNDPFVIKSSKSEHVRSLPGFPISHPEQLRLLNPRTKVLVVSYDNYVNSIKFAKKQCNITHIDDILDCTHIFRHIQASWMSSRGVPLADISYSLGHLNNSTTKQYTHKEWSF